MFGRRRHPAPDLRVEPDVGQARDVVERQRLEAHPATLERDRLDPAAAGHAIEDAWSAGSVLFGEVAHPDLALELVRVLGQLTRQCRQGAIQLGEQAPRSSSTLLSAHDAG